MKKINFCKATTIILIINVILSTTGRQGQIFTALDFSKCYLILKQATLTV